MAGFVRVERICEGLFARVGVPRSFHFGTRVDLLAKPTRYEEVTLPGIGAVALEPVRSVRAHSAVLADAATVVVDGLKDIVLVRTVVHSLRMRRRWTGGGRGAVVFGAMFIAVHQITNRFLYTTAQTPAGGVGGASELGGRIRKIGTGVGGQKAKECESHRW
jgi:hypothetical protein